MNSKPLKKTGKKYFPKKGCENQLIILPLQSEIQEIILKDNRIKKFNYVFNYRSKKRNF